MKRSRSRVTTATWLSALISGAAGEVCMASRTCCGQASLADGARNVLDGCDSVRAGLPEQAVAKRQDRATRLGDDAGAVARGCVRCAAHRLAQLVCRPSH